MDARAALAPAAAPIPGAVLHPAAAELQRRLVENLTPVLQRSPGARVVLLSRLPDVPLLNLACLGLLLQGPDERQGTYIAVDRPPRYVRRLLNKYEIASSGLLTVDGVGGMAAEQDDGVAGSVVTTPFALGSTLAAMRDDPRLGDFVLVDNLSSLLNFLSSDDIASVVSPLRALQGDPRRRHLVVIASYHSALERTLADGWDATVEIKNR